MADDFVFEHRRTDNARFERAQRFLTSFSAELAGSPMGNLGFDVVDVGRTQPSGKSCLVAGMVAAARGMRLFSGAFDTTVKQLMQKAREMGIVGAEGIPPTYAGNISELAAHLNLKSRVRYFYPNEMTPQEIRELAREISFGIGANSAVMALIPSMRHWQLLNRLSSQGFSAFDTLFGTNTQRSIADVASGLGHIVNGEMVGERREGNAFIVLSEARDPSFIVNDW